MTERIAVKVREFLPDAICSRENGETQVRVMQGCERAYTDCYQSFLELWRKLMRLMGLSALISVTDVVEDNGTAYAIYEYTDAVPLRKYLLSTGTGIFRGTARGRCSCPRFRRSALCTRRE